MRGTERSVVKREGKQDEQRCTRCQQKRGVRVYSCSGLGKTDEWCERVGDREREVAAQGRKIEKLARESPLGGGGVVAGGRARETA